MNWALLYTPKVSNYGNDSNLIYIQCHRYVRQYRNHMMHHVMTSHACLGHLSFNNDAGFPLGVVIIIKGYGACPRVRNHIDQPSSFDKKKNRSHRQPCHRCTPTSARSRSRSTLTGRKISQHPSHRSIQPQRHHPWTRWKEPRHYLWWRGSWAGCPVLEEESSSFILFPKVLPLLAE